MSEFKDRLWRELVREHGSDLAQMSKPVPKHGRARPRLLVGSTLGLAGVGTALALVLGAASSSPAFAVTRNHDGTVQVVITRLAGIRGANAKLASLGVRARVVEVAAGCKAVVPSHLRAAGVAVPRRGVRNVRIAQIAFAQVRLDPRTIPAGRTVVLPTMRTGHLIHITRANWVRGAAPDCLPPPLAPRAIAVRPGHLRAMQCFIGRPPSGKSGNSGNSSHSGNSGPPPPPIKGRGLRCRVISPPHPGNSGNSGNSGTSGNS